MLVEQLADESTEPGGRCAGKDEMRCQLHAQALMSKYFFVTHPVMVQEQGQILNKDGLLLLRSAQAEVRSRPSANPLSTLAQDR